MRRLLLATRNEGKVREFEKMLDGLAIELETLAGHPELAEVEETGETFDENARLKATAYARATGQWAVAEDSGLVVDALGGAPGVRSARFAGAHGDDAANNRKLVAELRGKSTRSARYVCAIVLARPDGGIVTSSRGICEGEIIDEPRGEGGFGYDPHFVPAGETRTTAELSTDDKNALSHRGEALRSFLPLLRSQFHPTDRS